ncbi:hypothetical protein [Aliikangiella sp. IMCC44359]|uniref:hypothetical protein n=1 Tax=Aliikangiella sp. IMCC44359 TaxID=3459125 RepID=UPI00403B0045
MQSNDNYFSNEKLNFVLAICAILISAASFYATYLQAKSSEQQVKAMTYPMIQFLHGNYDTESEEKRLTFTLKNAGVGPALVKSVSYEYQGKSYSSMNAYLKACCELAYQELLNTVKDQKTAISGAQLTSAQINNRVFPAAEEVNFLSINYDPMNEKLWYQLNKERWKLNLTVCYCSLLDNCYLAKGKGDIINVSACPTQ